MQGTNLRNMSFIVSATWMEFFRHQEEKIHSQGPSTYTPFRNPYIIWFLNWISSGGCTRKTYIEARNATKWKCFWRIFRIFHRMQVPMNIKSKLKLYRCIFLPELNQKTQQSDSKKQTIRHQLPSSWSYDKDVCINWCRDKEEEGKQSYILEIRVTPQDLFILNIQNNLTNKNSPETTGQREVILAPCILVVDKILHRSAKCPIKTVKCSIKNYYKINLETGNVYV